MILKHLILLFTICKTIETMNEILEYLFIIPSAYDKCLKRRSPWWQKMLLYFPLNIFKNYFCTMHSRKCQAQGQIYTKCRPIAMSKNAALSFFSKFWCNKIHIHHFNLRIPRKSFLSMVYAYEFVFVFESVWIRI